MTRRAWLIDGSVAVIIGVAQVLATASIGHRHAGQAGPLDLALVALTALPLVVRRRVPVTALAATFGLTLVYACTSYETGFVWLPLIVTTGTAIWYRQRRPAVLAVVCGYVAFSWGPPLVGTHPGPSPLQAVTLAAGLGALLAAAEGVRLRAARAEALTRSTEEMARRLAGEERLRMARDLHDVVAHNISVINVTANTALHLSERHPERAREALATINDVSRQALDELRSVLGVLRQPDGGAPRAPSAGLHQLDSLARQAGAAGIATSIEQQGTSSHLPTSVDLAAHRIIQEALTNTVRHSGGHRAVVRICYAPDAVRVQIDDDGRPDPAAFAGGSGQGIAGMTERAVAIGGHLKAGPGPAGGFRVQAWLPLEQTP